ncbi:FtsK/SpoIIIE family [Micromonospora carbonacea]|uniref:FtsK/SpoIIIE family n=2 Tax=Micromonospora carbonacea TaxID=47853 RepID=A0A1C5ABA5_9ACTN|nr:FtsK/SpoIIIE family [Micromonospora carbonacea]
MHTTEHRPASLPNRADPSGDARPTPGDDPAATRRQLPPGASHWSRTYYDDQGMQQVAKVSVPVTGQGRIAANEWECPTCGPQSRRWMSATLATAPFCDLHDMEMRKLKPGRNPSVGVTPPWKDIVRAVDHRIRVGAAIAAAGTAGLTVDVVDMPWWGHAAQIAAIPAAISGSWWLTRVWLIREAVRLNNLDPDDEVAGRRERRNIAKRARIAAYCAAAGMSWIEIADLLNIASHPARGVSLIAGLIAAGVIASRPYLNWVDRRRRAKPTPAVAAATAMPDEPPAETPTDDEQLAAYVTGRWNERISAERGPLPGTYLEAIRRTYGGWSAVVVATDESDLDPERFETDKTIGKIARAYGVGVTMVTVTADPLDANRAMILVQRTSPLSEARAWDGTGIDLTTGKAYTASVDDGDRAQHPFWRPGWGAVMELLAGATGSGKSEYLNLLLALERQSGVCVSWVCDPQMGQSLGDIRDGVDWFAPTVEEFLIMLRVAVQVMLARNVLITRMRVKETRPSGEVVERRVKYVEVSADFPLLDITCDEAHIPMNDPDHGKEIVALLALLAKSGRKCNIKVRLITQSPLLTELKNSVLRSQLSSGFVAVFRTADKLTGAACWPGKMPGDPALLPAEWPNGNTAAGVCYMSGQKPLRHRSDYVGDVYDLMHSGETKGLEPAVLGAAGVLYADRHKRLAAFDAMDPAELLGTQIPTLDRPAGQGDPAGGKGGGREAVLEFFADRWNSGDVDPIKFGVIDENVKAVKTRALTNVLNKLVQEQVLANETGPDGKSGWYRLTESGAEHLGVDEVGL